MGTLRGVRDPYDLPYDPEKDNWLATAHLRRWAVQVIKELVFASALGYIVVVIAILRISISNN